MLTTRTAERGGRLPLPALQWWPAARRRPAPLSVDREPYPDACSDLRQPAASRSLATALLGGALARGLWAGARKLMDLHSRFLRARRPLGDCDWSRRVQACRRARGSQGVAWNLWACWV